MSALEGSRKAAQKDADEHQRGRGRAKRVTNIDDKKEFGVDEMPESQIAGTRSPRSLSPRGRGDNLAKAMPSLSKIHYEDAPAPAKKESVLSGLGIALGRRESKAAEEEVTRNQFGLATDKDHVAKELGGLKQPEQMPEYVVMKSGRIPSMRMPNLSSRSLGAGAAAAVAAHRAAAMQEEARQQALRESAGEQTTESSARPPRPNESDLQRQLRDQYGEIQLDDTPEAQLAQRGLKINAPGARPSGRLNVAGSPNRKALADMTDEERREAMMLDEVGGLKSIDQMPEFAVLAEMGVKVRKPGEAAPGENEMVRMADGTMQPRKKRFVGMVDENGLPVVDEEHEALLRQIEAEVGGKKRANEMAESQLPGVAMPGSPRASKPLKPAPVEHTEQQKANIAASSMINGVKNDVAWGKQSKGQKTSLNEYLNVYEEYDLGIFPQMSEEEFAAFQRELLKSGGGKDKAKPDFGDSNAPVSRRRNVDQVIADMQPNNYFLGTGNMGVSLTSKYVLKEPVLIPVPYGEKWSMDIFALPHNAIKRELVDLYKILGSLQKRMMDLRHTEIDDFYNWWEVFEAFVLDFFEMEEGIIFPWIESRIPLGKSNFSQTQRSIVKGRLSRLMHEIDDCEYKFTNLPAGEVLPRLLECLDRFTPKLLEYFGEQERRLPRAIEVKFEAVDKRWVDENCLAFMMNAKYTNELVTIMTRWLNENQLREWKRNNLKGTARLSYSMWRNQLNKNHISIVTDMKQRQLEWKRPGASGVGKKAEAEFKKNDDHAAGRELDELGLPTAKPGLPTFSAIPGKFGDHDRDVADMRTSEKKKRGLLDKSGDVAHPSPDESAEAPSQDVSAVTEAAADESLADVVEGAPSVPSLDDNVAAGAGSSEVIAN
eukprot:CAMPEP_0185851674 /NCGR_PEP_ID=MMETSP1354-20130828/10969_1 /TAXON_ID=708628 /ORGANISM="Erythrolobus madagascarensis, Strain CCMP3276" /LENGTH=881 /DNA_ID=CAMNT_0028552709 /DNA_START=27 /DNA_END=2672 /DNA_ORIENTATION=+